MTDEPRDPFREHMLVELMGHRRIAGLVTEQQIAGYGFLRIDVPGVPAEPKVHFNLDTRRGAAHGGVVQVEEHEECNYYCRSARPEIPPTTQFVAPSSIYAMHPISEEMAKQLAVSFRVTPVSRMDLPQLTAGQSREELPFADEA